MSTGYAFVSCARHKVSNNDQGDLVHRLQWEGGTLFNRPSSSGGGGVEGREGEGQLAEGSETDAQFGVAKNK